jgi:outer membrane protein
MATQYGLMGWILAALLVSGTAQADSLFGFHAGAGSWQQDFSGEVAAGGEDIDVERDLDFDRESNNMLYLALEHGIPVLPNIRVNHAKVVGSGRNVLERTVEFRGQTFLVSEDVASEVSLTQTDAVFYYQLLDNVVSLDLGLTARWVDGDVEVVSDSTIARAEFKGVLPLLYGRTRVDLPLTGLWAGAEATGLAYDGHQLLDASVQVGWTSPIGLGAELGWRTLRLELDDIDDIDNADVDISGPYFALNFYF